MLPRIVFAVVLLFTVTPWASPTIALALGLALALTLGNPFSKETSRTAKLLLQISVVGLGFGMDLHQVLAAGRSGFLYTAAGITLTLAVGLALARALRVEQRASYLIATGTAICGGSAIAAVAPIIQASDEEVSVSIGTVFILNAVALFLFPPLGMAFGLTQEQFGLWAALAIHDTSSVVGASAKYGALALAIGTTVKLARALWIAPVALGTAALRHSKARIQWPWFILFFVLAAVVSTYLPQGQAGYAFLYRAARIGLTVTLFLIGAGVTRETLRRVGARPLVLGILLWLCVSVSSLLLIRNGWIAL